MTLKLKLTNFDDKFVKKYAIILMWQIISNISRSILENIVFSRSDHGSSL